MSYHYGCGFLRSASSLARSLLGPIVAAISNVKMKAIRPRFDDRKTAAAASVLLDAAGGEMKYFRLIKLLYIAEREAWRELGHAISGDAYVAMKDGPVLSRTYDLLKDQKTLSASTAFSRLIKKIGRYSVGLKEKPDDGPLSENEIAILKRVHEANRHKDQWTIRDLTHQFPEWHDPGSSSVAIDAEDVLRRLSLSDQTIERIREEVAEDRHFARLFQRA